MSVHMIELTDEEVVILSSVIAFYAGFTSDRSELIDMALIQIMQLPEARRSTWLKMAAAGKTAIENLKAEGATVI